MITARRRLPSLLLGASLAAPAVLAAMAVSQLGAGAASSGPAAGQVLAWGYNGDGQLGDGSSDTSVHATSTTASLPAAAGSVIAVSGGPRHTLFATTTGLYAVGDNATASSASRPTPGPRRR